jgi:hypothetical protein
MSRYFLYDITKLGVGGMRPYTHYIDTIAYVPYPLMTILVFLV